MTGQGAAPSGCWDPYQWAQIVQLAQQHRELRRRMRDPQLTELQRKAVQRGASRCARNLRAWAHIADLKTPILR